ncbi:MAG: phospholipase [Nonlabens sp.]
MTDQSLSLRYRIRPSSIDNAPLLLLLHGYGSNEDDLFAFAPQMDERFLIISARAPYDMQPYGAAWYAINFDATGGKFSDTGQALQSMATLEGFLQELQLKYSINKDNRNILGFSQGAILSYGLSLSRPELLKNIVAMSGYLNEELIRDKERLEERLQTAAALPEYFISHGTMDQVVPYTWASKAPLFLDGLGLKNKFHDYPIGHGVSPANFADMKRWLEKRVFDQ